VIPTDIKMDIAGGEPEALIGGLLQRHQPVLAIRTII